MANDYIKFSRSEFEVVGGKSVQGSKSSVVLIVCRLSLTSERCL